MRSFPISRKITRSRTRTGADGASRAELRRIESHAGKLSKKLLNPTDTQHVPEALRRAVAALLDQISLETAVQAAPATGKAFALPERPGNRQIQNPDGV